MKTFVNGKLLLLSGLLFLIFGCSQETGGVGSRVFVMERSSSSIAVVDYRRMKLLKRISVTANLRHASMVFDADLRYGYIASRDGFLVRIDLINLKQAGALKTSKNSIGLAISQDGKTIGVSEYKPGGITLVDVESFKVKRRIPARVKFQGKEILSRVTGLVDGAENSFVCALMDADQIWELKPDTAGNYRITRRIKAAAPNPFDALITTEGRYYVSGHFRSERVSLVDFWSPGVLAKDISFRKPKKDGAPVKMPHMEAWASAGDRLFIPMVGEKKLMILSSNDFRKLGTVPLKGYPVYSVVKPDHKEVWVSFSGRETDGQVQIINTRSGKTHKILSLGKRIYHLVFTPRGDRALISSNETNEMIIMDTQNYQVLKRIKLKSPSGIFGSWRAFQIGL